MTMEILVFYVIKKKFSATNKGSHHVVGNQQCLWVLDSFLVLCGPIQPTVWSLSNTSEMSPSHRRNTSTYELFKIPDCSVWASALEIKLNCRRDGPVPTPRRMLVNEPSPTGAPEPWEQGLKKLQYLQASLSGQKFLNLFYQVVLY